MMNTTQRAKYTLETVLELFGTEHVKVIKGGTVIDYVCAHLRYSGEDATAQDAHRWLTTMFSQQMPKPLTNGTVQPRTNYQVIEVEPLEDLALFRYLESLRLPTGLAQQLLDEVYIRDRENNRKFYAIGLKNEDGGYAFCNPLVQGFVGSQTVSFVRNKIGRKVDTVNLFLNFQDMLTAFVRFPDTYRDQDSICVNSLPSLPHAFGYITGYGYRFIATWMQNDGEGQQADELIRRYANTQRGLTHKRMNSLYLPYLSLNNWHVQTVHD